MFFKKCVPKRTLVIKTKNRKFKLKIVKCKLLGQKLKSEQKIVTDVDKI